MKLLSIIIPIYNAEIFLERCIDSVEAQYYPEYELILVDDGSSDKSLNICYNRQISNSRIKVFHKDNGGVSSARNFGIDKARGDYIGFLDPDDWIEPEIYTDLIRSIENDHVEIAICNYNIIIDNVRINPIEQLQMNEEKYFFNGYTAREELLKNDAGVFVGHCCDKVFRREIIADIRLNEKIYCYEDLLFVFETMKKVKKVSFINKTLYNYYFHNNNMMNMRTINKKKLTSLDAIDIICQDICENEYNDDLLNRAVGKKLQEFCNIGKLLAIAEKCEFRTESLEKIHTELKTKRNQIIKIPYITNINKSKLLVLSYSTKVFLLYIKIGNRIKRLRYR